MHAELTPLMRHCLETTTVRLAGEFRGVFSRETVARYVEESYDQVGDRPTVGPNFLPVIIERFARERLWAVAQADGMIEKPLPEVLFVCERNAGRSQMAACLAHHLSNGWIAVRSAGAHPDEQIDPVVVQAMAEVGLDVGDEFPKPLTDEVIRAADVVVTLGCGDACAVYPGKRYQDWPVADPAGQPIEAVRQVRYELYHHVWELIETLVPAGDLLDLATTRKGAELNRVAVITDIHGNLPALEASLHAIDAIGVDALYCGGDLVGYGPHPNEVCRLIEERAIPTIYGNYDYAIARELDDCGCAYVTQHDRELGQRSVAWTLAHTDQRSKDFMRELPFDLRFELGSQQVHLVHGSPRKVNEYLFEDKPASLYERLAAAETAGTLVFGHTHKPWIHEYGGVLFVNCGSVGKPKDGDPRAGFAILELDEAGGVRASIERVPYDAQAVAREVAAAGLPGEYAEKLVAAA